MPNVTELAEAAEVSRKQVRRDLENGAPGTLKAYLAWRRSRHSDVGTKEHALARGADTWRAYDHASRRYSELGDGRELAAEITRRVRAALANLPDLAELLSRCDQSSAYGLVRDHMTNHLYGEMQLAFLQLQAREPDAPPPLQRPADGSLAGIRRWIREGQATRQAMRTDVRDHLLVPTEQLVYEMHEAAAESRLLIVGIAGGIAAFAGRPAEAIRARIKESLEDAFTRMEQRFAEIGGKKR